MGHGLSSGGPPLSRAVERGSALVCRRGGVGSGSLMAETSSDVVRVLVEVPKGSRNKYEWDEETGTMALNRRLFAAVSYPTDYGMIPGTLAEDGDELDAMVALTEPTFPGCTIRVNPVALLLMKDGEKRNDKVLAVPLTDPAWNWLDKLDDLPEQLAEEIVHFFYVYNDLEGGEGEIEGWGSRVEALEHDVEVRERDCDS